MRRSAAEKMEVIKLVEGSDLSVRQTLKELDIPRSTFYDWYHRYLDNGYDGLRDKKPTRPNQWNQIPETIRNRIVQLALERTDLSPRELACHFTDEYLT
jgi:transposase